MAIHQCPRCELRFGTSSEYHDHLRMDHGVDPQSLESIRYARARQQKPLYPDLTEDEGRGATQRVLVVGNAALRAQRLQDTLTRLSSGRTTTFRLVVPAVEQTPVAGEHSWYQTVGTVAHPRERDLPGRVLARHRLDEAIDRFQDAGVDIDGIVGSADPMRAVAEGLEGFEADQILVSTLPRGLSKWLEADLPREIEHRYRLPVTVVEATET